LSEALVALVLAFVRTSALVGTLPMWSSAAAPRWVGALVALGTAALLGPSLPAPPSLGGGSIAVAAFSELTLGALAGLTVRAVFSSLTLAAEIGAQQAGFSFAMLFDPVTNARESPFGMLAGLLGTAMFMGTGQHLALLVILAESFERWPIGTGPTPGMPLVRFLLGGFTLGVQMSGPLLIGGLLLQMFIGLLTKVAPRLHAFFAIGPTLTALIGLLLFTASLPWLLSVHATAVDAAVAHVRSWLVGV
jgi:flagellar biosynthetic protein FliR